MENNIQENINDEIFNKKSHCHCKKWRYVFGIAILASFFGALFGFIAAGVGKKTDNFSASNSIDKNDRTISTERIVVEDSEIISVVENSSPAVVSIIITKEVPRYRSFDFFGFGLVPEESMGTERQEVGGGTGFFISADGMIATNKHVVSDEAAEYSVITNDEKKYDAKVLARDPVNDIAIIKIEGKDFPVLPLGDSSSIKIGQSVIAIGNSLGEFSNTVSKGIVSGIGRTLIAGDGQGGQTERLTDIIQTDAAINPGNSGGPLISMSGEIIGMNVAMAQGAQNIGFALPISQVKRVTEQIKDTGKISYPFLGVRYLVLDKEIKDANNLQYDYGVLVRRGQNNSELAVVPGSPADKAGIVEGDIILEFDGKKIDDKNQLSEMVAQKNMGDTVMLKIYRKGEEKELKVVLEERK